MRTSLLCALAIPLFLAGCKGNSTDVVGSVGELLRSNSGTLENLQKTAQDTVEYTKQGIEEGKKTVDDLRMKAALIGSGVTRIQGGIQEIQKATGR